MSSELMKNWPMIKAHFRDSFRPTRFYNFATVNPDGSPHMAPYASLVLNDDGSGFYCEAFPNQMSRNLKADPRICIIAVRSGLWFWLKALFAGGFTYWPGIRLYGNVAPPRKGTAQEIEVFLSQVKRFKGTKGYKHMWADISIVRDIQFERFEPVHAGAMTRHLDAG